MFAVVKTGGKQYRVSPQDVLTVEYLAGEKGSTLKLPEVLLVGTGESLTVGTPSVAHAYVAAEIVEQSKGDKIRILKKRRRKNSRRVRGHRQLQTVLRVTGISPDGKALVDAAPAKTSSSAAPSKKAASAQE